MTATTISGAHRSSTEHVRWQQQGRKAARPSTYNGQINIRCVQQLHRVCTMATTISGLQSSSSECVRWQQQYQAHTAASPSAYDGNNNIRGAQQLPPNMYDSHINIRRTQQLHRAQMTATTGANSSSTECVQWPQHHH